MKVFVGCSSSDDLSYEYYVSAFKVAKVLSENDDLTFGGYNAGVMGILYRAFKNNNRKITAVVPEVYREDLKDLKCETSIIVDNSTERSHELFKNADVLLFLPGGIGTMSELFAALEEKRNGMDKPIIIYNEYNLFDNMLNLLDHIDTSKLSKTDNLYVAIDNQKDLSDYMNNLKDNSKVKEKTIWKN